VQAVRLPRIGRVNCARYTDSLELNERRAHARKSYALQPGALPLERDTVSPRPPRARRHRVHDSFRRSPPPRDFHPSLSSRRSTFTAIPEERERETVFRLARATRRRLWKDYAAFRWRCREKDGAGGRGGEAQSGKGAFMRRDVSNISRRMRWHVCARCDRDIDKHEAVGRAYAR